MPRDKVVDADFEKVDATKLPCLAQWRRDYTMETILIELRRYDQHAINIRPQLADTVQIHGSATTQEATAASRGNNVLM